MGRVGTGGHQLQGGDQIGLRRGRLVPGGSSVAEMCGGHTYVADRGAEREGTALRLPWTKEQVSSAPDYGKPDRAISEEMEREAYRHFGLESAAA